MQQQCGASEFVGLDTSQPFVALKQQVNIRSDSSRRLATAVVIGGSLDAKRQQRAETTSQRASCEPLYAVAERFSSCSSHCDTIAKILKFF